MSWRCSGCGETHDDAFRSCWQCGASRAISAGERASEEQELEAEAAEVAAEDAEQQRTVAVAAYQEEAGWYPAVRADKWGEAARAIHRLVAAHRLYRERQDSGARNARPDLDRLWTQFYLACAIPGGLVLGEVARGSWLERWATNGALFTLVHLGALIPCMVTGRRVVGRELRAAAEAAVMQGQQSVPRVT